jgi:hypothetical protein
MATKRRKKAPKLGDIVVIRWHDAASRDGWADEMTPDLKPPMITSTGMASHLPIKGEDYWNLVSMWEEETLTVACEQTIPNGMIIDVRIVK